MNTKTNKTVLGRRAGRLGFASVSALLIISALLLFFSVHGAAASSSEYTVSYDMSGGSGYISPVTCQAGSFITLAWPDDIRGNDGLCFGGWNGQSGRTLQPGEVFRPSSDVVFKALWVKPVTIYIDPRTGLSTNSGTSPSSPVSSITEAQSKVKSAYGYYGSVYSTTFVIMSPFESSSKGQTVTVPVTITSSESAGGETAGEEALFTLGGTLLAKAPVWFKDISMKDSGSHNLCGCGNPLRFSGIETPDGYTAANLFGAGSSINYPAGSDVSSTAVPTSLRIESGNFNLIYGGGSTVAASDVSIDFSGGRTVRLFGGGDTKAVTGDVVVLVSGGVVESLIAGGRSSGVNGGCSIFIEGGNVASVSEGCGDGKSVIKNGTFVGCSGEFVPVSYSPSGAAGSVNVALQYRFGETMRLAYPEGLYLENRGLYKWVLGDKAYFPGEEFVTGNTYLTFSPDWRVPRTVYVDQQNGKEGARGTKADPVRSFEQASSLLREADNGGSVYTNIISIEGTYKAVPGESAGTKPAAIEGGTLEFSDFTVENDLRIACRAVSGAGAITVKSGNILINHKEADFAQLVSAGGVCIAKGFVREVAGGSDLTICGGRVGKASDCADVRLESGMLDSADSTCISVTVTGGTLGSSECAKTEIMLNSGRSLEIKGRVNCSKYTGGGKLSFSESGSLSIKEFTGGITEITKVPLLSGAVLVSAPGVDESVFRGNDVIASAGEWKTGHLVIMHIGEETEKFFAAPDGSFASPPDLAAEGYRFGGWFEDADMKVPYEGRPASGTLELWASAEANAPCTLDLSTTAGKVVVNGAEYSPASYSDHSAIETHAGAVIELKAVAGTGTPFIFWLDENSGTVISSEPVLNFKMAADAKIAAVFGNRAGQTCTAFFLDCGRVVASVEVKRNSKLSDDQIPKPAALVPGKSFTGWDRSVTDKLTSDTVFNAVYENVPDRVTVTYTGSSDDGNGSGDAYTRISRIISGENAVTFVSEWNIADGHSLIRAGIELSSPDGKRSYTGSCALNESSGSYYLTKGSAGGNEWLATPYVCYASPDGRVLTVFGEQVSGQSGADACDPVSSSVSSVVSLDGGQTVFTSMREYYRSVVDVSDEYYYYDEMVEDLNILAERHSDKKIRLISIGKSVLGRDLWVMEVGNTSAPYRMFVKGTDHARELMNTVIVMKTLEYYLENWYNTVNGERVCDIFNSVCICFEPMANPDGVMLSQQGLNSISDPSLRDKYAGILVPIMKRAQAGMVRGVDYDPDLDLDAVSDENGIWWGRWAANINGVDLHRDYYENNLRMYNTAFQNYIAKHRTPDIKDAFGEKGLSQPETQAVASYIDSVRFNMSLTYHSYSPCLQLPTALAKSAQLDKNYDLIGLLSRITSYSLNANTGSEKATGTNAGYNNWFICKYPASACFTIETGYKQIGGVADNTPLKMAQQGRLFWQNRMGPILLIMEARDQKKVDALA